MCDGIFVYGTLMSGFINHDLYLAEHIVTMQPAKIKGRLFHLPVGYPALYAAGLDALMTAQGREVPSGNWRTFMQNSADRA